MIPHDELLQLLEERAYEVLSKSADRRIASGWEGEERRSGEERRQGVEPRQGEERRVGEERRAGQERRVGDERRGGERRSNDARRVGEERRVGDERRLLEADRRQASGRRRGDNSDYADRRSRDDRRVLEADRRREAERRAELDRRVGDRRSEADRRTEFVRRQETDRRASDRRSGDDRRQEEGPGEPLPMITDLPALGVPTKVLTMEPLQVSEWHPEGASGQHIINDNFGDGTLTKSEGKYRFTHRSGVPAKGGFKPNGCQYREKDDDGDPNNGWPLLTGPGPESGLYRPWKAIQSQYPDNPAGITNAGNIDTSNLCYIPTATGGPLWVTVHGCKPGHRLPGESGTVKEIQFWQSRAPGREPTNWTQPEVGASLIAPRDYPNVPWCGPYNPGGSEPGVREGGCAEPSIVYDPSDDMVRIFWEGQYLAEPAPINNGRLHHAIGRAEFPASEFGKATTPVPTWTPAPGPDSYVFRAAINGMKLGEEYGAWGTSEQVTCRSHVSVAPDGSYHMMIMGKAPNARGGEENRTSGIGHYWSHDKGFTWTADLQNPLVNWDTFGWPSGPNLPPHEPPYTAKKLNSPHIFWDPDTMIGYVGFWGTPYQINKTWTTMYTMAFPITPGGGGGGGGHPGGGSGTGIEPGMIGGGGPGGGGGGFGPMTELDDELVPGVAEMAEQMGKAVQVTERQPSYNRELGETTFVEAVHNNIRLLGMGPVETRYLDLGLARDGDTQALFASLDLPFIIRMGLRISFGGEVHTLTRFAAIHSGDQICAWKVFLRRA